MRHTRVRSQTPSASGGGGGAPVTAAVTLGPDFGEGAGGDGTTKVITTVADLEALRLAGNFNIGVGSLLFHVAVGQLASPNVISSVDGSATGPPFWQNASENNPTTAALSITVTKPTGTMQGDLLIAHITRVGTNAITAPAGWTLVQEAASPGTSPVRSGVWWKIAGASEPADYTWSGTITTLWVGEIHRIIGAHQTTPINASAIATLNASALDPDPDSPGITTTVANTYVLALLGHHHLTISQTHTPNAGQAELTDHEAGTASGFIGQHTQSRVAAAAGGIGTISHNCTETIATDAVMIRVAIAPAASLDLTP